MLMTTAVVCLAMNMYHEARSEGQLGQYMVADVTLNRVESNQFPDTICEVVKQHKQFSWYSDGKPDMPEEKKKYEEMLELANEILEDPDILPDTDSLWYHADYVTPYWQKDYLMIGKVGRHLFYSKGK